MLVGKLKEIKQSIKQKTNHTAFNPFASYEDMGFRMFEPVIINDRVKLSIQASYGHYCFPRKTLPLDMYESVELAIFKDNEFTSVEGVMQNSRLTEKLSEYYEGTVYGYVPVKMIEELYHTLVDEVIQ